MSDEKTIHKPKSEFRVTHKVVRFGVSYNAESKEEQKLYYFRHQRADLKVTEGIIPVNFLSQMWLEEGHPIYLDTRCGGYDEEEERYIGPEYLVSWRKEKEVLPPTFGDATGGWSNNLDQLWISVLGYFERKNLLSEDSLDFLDADPYVLFGIDCHVSQQALKKLEKFPALLSEDTKPSHKEWGTYLHIRSDDRASQWLVEALGDTELPKPWTCYKGVGSIVCFIRSDTGQVTWKHPFYDYFRQLRDFCRQASVEEVMQVRVNRLLWSYEATRIETEHYQEPLIAPEFVEKLAKIFGIQVADEGATVRNLKAQLKVFAKSYRASQEIILSDVVTCSETLQKDVEKHAEMKHQWADMANADTNFELKSLANGDITCVNCDAISMAFCLECKDYLCLDCYDMLHRKGARREHAPFRLVACSLCINMPAKLHCTFTDKSLCHKCYAIDHIRILPPDGKENQPRQIDYAKQYIRYATFAKDRQAAQKKKAKAAQQHIEEDGEEEVDESYDSVLSTDWHPFYDSRGVKFYHNFRTGERMRQSPRRVPNCADPGAPPEAALSEKKENARHEAWVEENKHPKDVANPLALTGFDSLQTGTRAQAKAAIQPETRNLRAPHRVHMPNEVPQI